MVQQVAFEIPAEIAAGIATGELFQWGGIVRDGSGRIVKHLKQVDVADESNKAMQVAAQVMEDAKQNKRVAIGALIIAGFVAAGGLIYAGVTHFKHKKEKKARKEVMGSFNAALSEYLAALSEGTLTVEKIDALDASIAALGDNEKGVTVEIESEQFRELVKSVLDYTNRFSKANGYRDAAGAKLKLIGGRSNDISGLKECLTVQREILVRAA